MSRQLYVNQAISESRQGMARSSSQMGMRMVEPNTSSDASGRSKETSGKKSEEICIELLHTMMLFDELPELRSRLASRILLWATRKRFDSVVLLIVQKIPEVKNVADNYGNTALHIASYLCHTECMKILLMSNCERDAQNHKGYTPLHMAVKGGQITSLCWLCESGVNLNIQDKENNTALMLSICWNYAKLAQILLRYGCDVNKKGEHGRTALHFAILFEHVEIVQLLVGARADVEIPDDSGKRPLHYASYVGSTTSVGMLLQAGANPNSHDLAGNTPSQMTNNHIILDLLSTCQKKSF